jgi:putative chitinase
MLTSDQIQTLYPRASDAHVAAFVTDAGRLFRDFGIGAQENRLHFFLAQIGHESGGLTITDENLSYRAERICQVWPSRFPSVTHAKACERNPEILANMVYCDRMGNGPFASGDGYRFRGRGYIQITGRDGYRNVGHIAGLDLEAQPDLAGAPEHALRVACAFWRWKKLNELCDTGDFIAVTHRINGGTNGLDDRRAWLDKVRRTLGALPPEAPVQPSPAEVIAVQRELQARGYTELGAADGFVGPRTLAAIARFRQENGMPPGQIDPHLMCALGMAEQG